MHIVSWNVNGIRAVLRKNAFAAVEKLSPDVVCVQETKARREQVPDFFHKYPVKLWNSAVKPGYSGVGMFLVEEPKDVLYGLDIAKHDQEGRVITADLGKFFLVNVYTPNSKHGLLRLDYRLSWDADFRDFVSGLKRKKPVLVVGDLNVAHNEIDLAHPKTNRKNPGFSDEERNSFSSLLGKGFVDTFRMFESGPGHYTWWRPMFNARARNMGWRIDYGVCSDSLKSKVVAAPIYPKIFGSDHCPVGVVVE
ncbi:MAG: exodeoxyribonuclease III [Nanoarchaeota archaeon]|nr:exodeoxyribonuclease III [Nanoarchaeota archaeon]